jgi:competence ComEA-like helix-hairpin-helix protein
MSRSSGIILCVLALAPLARTQQSDQQAAKAFERTCSACHDSFTALSGRHTRGERQSVVDDMASRGAEGTPADLREVINWLVRHYGNIRINALSARDLQQEMELTASEAAAILAYRTKNGPFANFDAVKKTTGVDPSKLEPYKDSIVF